MLEHMPEPYENIPILLPANSLIGFDTNNDTNPEYTDGVYILPT